METEAGATLPAQMIQRDCQQYYAAAPVYFILFITLARTVFLNLYLATILDKLSSAVFKQKQLFESDFIRYRKVRMSTSSVAFAVPERFSRHYLCPGLDGV